MRNIVCSQQTSKRRLSAATSRIAEWLARAAGELHKGIGSCLLEFNLQDGGALQ
jgi:hypothetical protein